jgi:hypothetical protein
VPDRSVRRPADGPAPAARRIAAAVLVAALAAGTVLLLGRLGSGDHPGWGLAVGVFAVLLGAQLVGPGPHHRALPPGDR